MHKGFADANPYSRTLIERIRLSKETQWRRLLIWAAGVGASSVAAGLILPHYAPVPSPATLAVVSSIAACVAVGGTVHSFSAFALERRLGSLFAAAAFSTLAAGSMLQGLIDLNGTPPMVYGWIVSSARLLAALLLLGEAYATSRWRASGRLQAFGQFVVAGFAVVAFPLVIAPYVLDVGFIFKLSSSPFSALVCRIIDTVLELCTAGLMAWTLYANHRRYMDRSDGSAGTVCYFLLATIAGLLFCAASAERFDVLFTMGQVSFVWSWLALLIGSGLENAFAHKEAGERLEELEALHDVSWSLVGAGTVSELLELFVRTLVKKTGAGIAAVYLADGGDTLELAASCGANEADVGRRYSLVASGPWPGFHTGHTAKAFASRHVQVAHDVFVDVEFVPWRVIAGDDGCAASIPLADGDHGIGVLNVYYADARQLTTARLRLLATIAASATSAIEFAISKQLSEPDSFEMAA